ncbi:MAG: asparagine synthase-related protein [Ardenticatenaceae bacterium]|nr:asparagine synthase-related protein [Ardenticatenaceae bacterium]
MSALAAILNIDGRPVDRPLLARMVEAARPYGPESAGIWVRGAFGMGSCRLEMVEPRPTEAHPLVDGEHGLVLVWDGRLDNREDLLSRLAGVETDTGPSDARLLLDAYRLWGPACLERLVGDFAFVLWDWRAQRLLAARDPLGVRPLHYAVVGATCLIASRIDQLRQSPHLPQEINDGMVGDFLAGNLDNPDETFFRGISRLPPGHLLEVGSQGVRKRCYWAPDWDRTISYPRESEYADHFHSLLQQAVESRLRANHQTGLLLSGGLDSRAVACTIGELDQEKRCLRDAFTTFTATLDHLGSSAERRNAELVSKRYQFVAHYVRGDSTWTFTVDDAMPAAWDEPLEGMYVGMVQQLMDCAREHGIRVLLTGYGGDLLLAGSYYYLLDLLMARRWPALREELSCYSFRFRWWLIFNYLARPLIFRQPAGDLGYRLPEWIAPEFARRIDLKARLRAQRPARGRRRPSQQAEAEAISLAHHSNRMLWLQSEGLRHGLELRHPFFDRRLFEFLLAVPAPQKIQQGCPKALLHRALGPVLSETVCEEPGRNGSPALRPNEVRERAQWAAGFADPSSAALGYVDLPALQRAFRRYLDGDHSLKYALARTYRLELWLQRLFGNRTLSEKGRAVVSARG